MGIIQVSEMINRRSISQEVFDYLRQALQERKNIIISSGTGAGGTTLLNLLANELTGSIIVAKPPKDEFRTELKVANASIASLASYKFQFDVDWVVIDETRVLFPQNIIEKIENREMGMLAGVFGYSAASSLEHFCSNNMTISVPPDDKTRRRVSEMVDIVVSTQRLITGERAVTEVVEVKGIEPVTHKWITKQIFTVSDVNFETRKLERTFIRQK